MKKTLFLLGALTALGCDEELKTSDNNNGDGTPIGAVTTQATATGFETLIDATADAETVYFSFADGQESSKTGPWDLSFKRFTIFTNSGLSGSGKVITAAVDTCDALVAPTTGYALDLPDGDDDDDEFDSPFNTSASPWYAYNHATHQLAPNEGCYVVRSVAGAYFKVTLLGYYDDAGTAGFVSFAWQAIEAPATAPTEPAEPNQMMPDPDPEPDPEPPITDPTSFDVTVPAEGAAFISLKDQAAVQTDFAADDWDIAIKGFTVLTNSGVTGTGDAGARIAPEGMAWADAAESSTVGYQRDVLVPLPGPPGSGETEGNAAFTDWFNYNPSTHAVRAKRDLFHFVRAANGALFKFQILDVKEGTYTLRVAPLTRIVDLQESTIDTTTAVDGWIRFSFETGRAVEPREPWDIAFSSTLIQTASGTSAETAGGAFSTETPFADITDSMGDYTVDEMLQIPGAAAQASGNPALSEWFIYDPMTHTLSPKPVRFLVRARAGTGFVKLEIPAYTDGTYTLNWAFTGAGDDSFE